MNERPELNNDLDSKTFLNYYWLKEELAAFCRDNGLPSSGSKQELTERIAVFLDSGEIVKSVTVRKTSIAGEITPESIIEPDIVCSEKHRAFFKEQIGKSFSFNVAFQKWLKANAGKTYKDAIDAYHEIIESKKKTKPKIDSQFEYNTYIRDFFADNKGRTLHTVTSVGFYLKAAEGFEIGVRWLKGTAPWKNMKDLEEKNAAPVIF